MAKAKTSEARTHIKSSRSKRPGIHAKKKSTALKQSKNYKKAYRGQGKKR